ncbi:MAG: type II toxin-antitoxin system RelE/ParE family toxin [Candidatus Pacebacteria bacterium]|nr:type II toxin-antitoxin system RelE/ParE family toxin [Candidatus Paceibacterota bacterium]
MNSTNWKIEFHPYAQDQLLQIDKTQRQRITKYIRERLTSHPNPVVLSSPVVGDYKGLSRFRVGDYRLLAVINEIDKIITISDIGHRREIYK